MRTTYCMLNNNNKFICNSTELDSHRSIQYIQAFKIQGNTNAMLRDAQRDSYKEYISFC